MCNRMAECHFAHSEEELTNAPDLSQTKLCRSLLIQGRCTDAHCTFAHSKVELRHLGKDATLSSPTPSIAHGIKVDKHIEVHHGCFAEQNNGEESREAVHTDNGEEKRLLPDEATNPFDRHASSLAEPRLYVKNTFLTWGFPTELCCPRRSQSTPPRLATGPSIQAGCNHSDSMCKSWPINVVPTVAVHPMDMMKATPESPPQCLVVSPWAAFRRSSPPPRACRPSMGGVPKLM